MPDMQFSFDMKNWDNVADGVAIIPTKSIQVFFRQKPKWEYQMTWSNAEGLFDESYDNWPDAVRKIKQLEELGQEHNLYVRNIN